MTPIEIARQEERRQGHATAQVAREAEKLAGGWMTFGGSGSWVNQACGLGLDGPVSDADLDHLVEFYQSRGFEPRIEVSAFADPSLLHGLADRGFQLREFEDVLALPLPFGQAAPEPSSPWSIVTVDPADQEQLATYTEVATSGFREPGEPLSEAMIEATEGTLRRTGCEGYLVILNGLPVAACGMDHDSNTATLFGTSVLPSHRRRGIQGALIRHRVQRAQELGCNLATIHSHPGVATARNAMRLGFALVYCRVLMIKPGPGLEASP